MLYYSIRYHAILIRPLLSSFQFLPRQQPPAPWWPSACWATSGPTPARPEMKPTIQCRRARALFL